MAYKLKEDKDAYNKKYYEENKEKIKEKNRIAVAEYYYANKEQISEKKKKRREQLKKLKMDENPPNENI